VYIRGGYKKENMNRTSYENIALGFIGKWQEIADLLASILQVPAALIMKTENEFMEVFVSSQSDKNPYVVGEKEKWHGLYCETVIRTQEKLRIPNALKNKEWNHNPDLKLGMVAYLGFPISFPDGTPFGTICILDKKERHFTTDTEKLLLQFQKVIELDLALISSLELNENATQKEVIQQLMQSNNEYKTVNEEYQSINEEYLSTTDELQHANERLRSAKQEVEENELKFRMMYENTSIGIAVISLDFKIMAANNAYCKMLGYSEKELLGKNLEETAHPEVVAENIQLQIQLKKGEIPSFQLEKQFIHKSGKTVHGLLNATIIKNNDDEPLYFLGNVQDITTRRQAEFALQKNETKLRRIYRVAPVGIGMVVDRILKDVNPRICEMTGYTCEELIGQSARVLYPNKEEYEFVGREKYAQIREKETGEVETRWKKKDGTIINVLLASTPTDMNDFFKGVIFTALDITQQKEAEKALLDSELKYRRIAENVTDVVWVSDLNMKPTYISPSVKRVLGIDPDEYLKRPLTESYPMETLQTFQQVLTRELEKESDPNCDKTRVFEIEVKRFNSDGSIGWDALRATFLRDENLDPVAIQGVSRDITERKQAELIRQMQYNIAKATISAKNLNTLFDSISRELNSVIDARNIFIAFYEKETGLFRAILERDGKDEIPQWPAEKSLTGYVLKQNKSVHLKKDEILQLQQNGIIELIGTTAEAWLGVPLVIDNDTYGAVVIQNYDNPNAYGASSIQILELIAYELSTFIGRDRAREKVLELSRAVEQSSVSVIIIDVNRRIEYVNPYFTELTGYTFDEVVGQSIEKYRTDYHTQEFYDHMWKTILAGENWEGEIQNRKKSGALYWENAIISPIENNDGVITNVVAIKEDITDRKQMFEELIEAKEKAEESDRLKTAFLQNMSHEIRTPLNAIAGFSGMLNKPSLSGEKRRRFVSIIQNSSNQLLSIVTNILTISSLETKQERVIITPVSINDVLEELHTIFKKQAHQKNISLCKFMALANHKSEVYTDRTKVTQVLSNLISNALKFTHQGTIEFGYKLKRNGSVDELEFFVKDTGIGITKEEQEIIFKRFQQARKSINKLYGGTGLGLSISKGFVEILGGKMWVKAEPKKGSTFYFTLPYKPIGNGDD
jgi:PAS domain S-box-containing protein